jgi:hypothetical protein
LNETILLISLSTILTGAILYQFRDPLGDLLGFRGISSSYPSMDAAGKAAIENINETSITENREYGGKICKSAAGEFFYTNPKQGTEAGLNGTLSGLCPNGSTIVADYHTHGSPSPGAEVFSIPLSATDMLNDLATNQKGYNVYFLWNVYQHVGYLGTPSGKIKKYEPSTFNSYILSPSNTWEIEKNHRKDFD